MADPSFYENYGKITSHGSCDAMSGGMRLSYDYPLTVFGHAIYPENEDNVKIVVDAVRDPDNTYGKFILDHEKEFEFDLTTIHYRKTDTINKLLESQNVNVIYITYTVKDVKLITTNCIYKIIEQERALESDKLDYFKELLTRYQLTDYIDELEKTQGLYNLSDSILNKIISAHSALMMQHRKQGVLEDHERLLKIPFNLMYSDSSALLELLSNFTRLEVNESTNLLYKDYMNAQQPILKKFELTC
jgi:hypothetical protein